MVQNSVFELAGLSFKSRYFQELLDDSLPHPGWVEVISENFLGDRGRRLKMLKEIRERYPVSMHGVGMNLGSPYRLSGDYLKELKWLINEIDPVRVSDHMCWSSGDNCHFHDLYPMLYTEEAVKIISQKIRQVQDYLERPLLIENLSAYLQFEDSELTENEFINQLCENTGCQRLVDINNLYVQEANFGESALKTLEEIPSKYIGEYHIAGFTRKEKFVIDTHSKQVDSEVWPIFEAAVKKKVAPFLLEWDADLPDYQLLQSELQLAVDKCQEVM